MAKISNGIFSGGGWSIHRHIILDHIWTPWPNPKGMCFHTDGQKDSRASAGQASHSWLSRDSPSTTVAGQQVIQTKPRNHRVCSLSTKEALKRFPFASVLLFWFWLSEYVKARMPQNKRKRRRRDACHKLNKASLSVTWSTNRCVLKRKIPKNYKTQADSKQPLSSSEVPVELKPFDLTESQNVKRKTLKARN